ncbi:hypothetical protein [Synechococcus phage BUCT-ZZ01]|nr:hypothetical protein [Synechococcus phage BUCT-ZZ01]
MLRRDQDLVMRRMVNQYPINSSYDLLFVFEKFAEVSNSGAKDRFTAALVFETVIKDLQSGEGLVRTINEVSTPTLKEIEHSYALALQEFLDNNVLSQVFKMDDDDELGWEIFNSLSRTRDAVMDMINYREKRKSKCLA